MKTVLYARVSTVDQTIDHQRTQAEAAGFNIDAVLADQGVSGVHVPLAERPQGKRLFDLLRAGDTLVVRWVDRLGRNYADVSDTIREFIIRFNGGANALGIQGLKVIRFIADGSK